MKLETRQQQPNLNSTDNIAPSTKDLLAEIIDIKSLHFEH